MFLQGFETAAGVGMTAKVDFTRQAFFRDLAAGTARLRALGPVVADPVSIVSKVWITTMHDATARVLTDNETFTMRKEDGARVRHYGA